MLASLIFITDQVVKYMMIGPLALESRRVIRIMPFFDLRWAENRGISMGFLEANSETQRWMLVGLTAVIAAIVAIWMLREKLRGDVLALAMVLGGAFALWLCCRLRRSAFRRLPAFLYFQRRRCVHFNRCGNIACPRLPDARKGIRQTRRHGQSAFRLSSSASRYWLGEIME